MVFLRIYPIEFLTLQHIKRIYLLVSSLLKVIVIISDTKIAYPLFCNLIDFIVDIMNYYYLAMKVADIIHLFLIDFHFIQDLS